MVAQCTCSLHSSKRYACSYRPVTLQRFAPSPRRDTRSASSSTRTSSFSTPRPPTQNLLSPFGSVLHGSARGPRATFAEPLDAWLAVLADTVPFYRDCLVVCPSTSTRTQVLNLLNRCREHIPTAHVGALGARSQLHDQAASPLALKRGGVAGQPSLPLVSHPHASKSPVTSGSSISGSHVPSPVVPVDSSPSAVAGRTSRPAALSRPLPALRSPLEDIAANSLDLVVFTNNVFAHEMLLDAPWHLSLAHRALRPHGVVAIVGHVADAEVVAPDWAVTSCVDYTTGVQEEAQQDLELAALEAVQAVPSSEAHVRRLRHALGIQETLRTGHSDIFFPFPSVRRRWFTSEYALDPRQVMACYRGAPLYQALYGPAGAMWLSAAQYALRQERLHRGEGQKDLHESSGDGDRFFVDLNEVLESDSSRAMQNGSGQLDDPLSTSSLSQAGDLASPWSPLGVQRRRSVVDPLDALQAILEAHAGGARTGESQWSQRTRHTSHSMEPSLRLQVRHFVITCSSRSISATSDLPQPPSLPGTIGRCNGGQTPLPFS
ncbi:hypothetical protein ABL78_7139 [Leptomonas seymouri]|uniref:Uncharacterized protein n=1 Tax=Leptomonas seymouri TaxID=5684 RepID=A0A0N0P3L8_LEPSE|nr:hypothetical protein ABL78_7139 [Leptomonas seymouri]|eukprot:KPI83817.1 hypothetical protein ABL78_7139 [Leptomonas seymouri]